MKVIRVTMAAATLLFAGTLATAVMASGEAQQQTPPASGGGSDAGGGSGKGWTIPAGASQEPNPIAASPDILSKGKELYEKKCQKCHGKEGKGDGPDADADMPPEDLTDASRAGRNPDGVMFYKVWNGRKSPKMPAFKTELSKEEVWTVVTYAKSLRKS
jgi:mono/diheme cytochrome c family protein